MFSKNKKYSFETFRLIMSGDCTYCVDALYSAKIKFLSTHVTISTLTLFIVPFLK